MSEQLTDAKKWLKEAHHNGWDGPGFKHLTNVISELEQEHEIRESREDVITMIAENLKIEHEPHQTFFERLIEATQNEQ